MPTQRLSGWALERQQLRFMLWKQALLKKRGWIQTLVEIISPVVVMLALVYAYNKVEVEHVTEHIYANDITRMIDEGTRTLMNAYSSSDITGCASSFLQQLDLPPLDLSSLTAFDPGDPGGFGGKERRNLGAAAGSGKLGGAGHSRQLQQQWQQQPGSGLGALLDLLLNFTSDGWPGSNGHAPDDPAVHELAVKAGKALVDAAAGLLSQQQFADELRKCSLHTLGNFAWAAKDLFMLYVNTKGPLPVLTFDEFMLLSKVLNALAKSNPQLEDILYNFRRDFGWNWLGNLVGTGGVAFVPDTPEVLAFANYMSKSHAYFDDVFLGVYKDESELEQMAADGYRFWAVVVFDKGPSPKLGADYTIRMSLIETPETWVPINKFEHWSSRRYKFYFLSGFYSIEAAINNYLLGHAPDMEASLIMPQTASWDLADHTVSLSSHVKPQAFNIWVSIFPKPGFIYNRFYAAVGPMLGLLMCLSLIFPLAMLIRGIVEEKETKLREVLYIMGLRPWVLHASWLIIYFCVFTAVSVLTVLVASTTFLSKTSWTLLLCYIMVFSVSELCFGIMMSTLFSRAKVSAIVGPIMHFAFVMPRYIFFKTGSGQAIPAKVLTSLLAPSAFTFGMDLVGNYEALGVGLQWGDVLKDDYPFLGCMAMMLLDSALYLLLAAYLDKVVPSGFGASLPFYFLCDPRYWRGATQRWRQWSARTRKAPGGANQANGFGAMELGNLGSLGRVHYTSIDSSNAEEGAAYGPGAQHGHRPSTGELQRLLGGAAEAASRGGGATAAAPAVEMLHLRMCYPNGVVAVHDLTLSMYSGQITSLLGHNGAGKSTTVAMMTGLTIPTSGDATIDGASITSNTMAARQSLGICPQQNVLVEGLSVSEHLILLAAIKGVAGKQCSVQAAEMQATICLPNDGATLSKNLSGGMKRKLQVGMALIGGSTVVVLDEPTSGMDPSARRALWSLMRAAKADRALLLTTHYMDEADILSDKVAIMSAGRLCCEGSPLQLKERYGHGYTLTLTKLPSAGFDTVAIEAAVQSAVPTAQLLRHAAAEVIMRLPLTAAPQFPSLFDLLEQHASELGVAHYGISMPTMEEVFLRATDESHDKPYSLAPQSRDADKDGIEMVGMDDSPLLGSRLNGSNGHAAGRGVCSSLNGSNGLGPGNAKQAAAAKAAAAAVQAPSGLPHWWRCFKQMLTKRKIITLRDWKGLLYLFLLPVVAVGLTLLILTINIDPSGPRLVLSLHTIEQYTPVPVANNPAPGIFTGCLGPTSQFQHKVHQQTIWEGWVPKQEHGEETCPYGTDFMDINATDSSSTSSWLLEQYHSGHIPQYGALVFHDELVLAAARHLNDSLAQAGQEIADMASNNHELLFQLGNVSEYTGLLAAAPGAAQEVALYALTKLDSTAVQQYLIPFLDWLQGAQGSHSSVDRRLTAQPLKAQFSSLLSSSASSSSPLSSISTPSSVFKSATSSSVNPAVSSQPRSLLMPKHASVLSSEGTSSSNGSSTSALDLGTGIIVEHGGRQLQQSQPLPDSTSPADLAKLLDELNSLLSNSSRVGDVGTLAVSLLGPLGPLAPLLVPLLAKADPAELRRALEDRRKAEHVMRNLAARFQQPPVTLMMNASSYHGMMALYTDVQQSLLNLNWTLTNQSAAMVAEHQAAHGVNLTSLDRELRVTNHPLPLTNKEHLAIDTFLSILAAIFVMVPFCYLSGAYAVSPVSETASGSKALQLGAGCPRLIYWAGSLAWDLSIHLAVSLVSLATFAAFNDQATTGNMTKACAAFLLIFGYGAGVIPLSYCYAFGFRSPSTAQVSVSALNFLLGFMFVVGSETMKGIPECQDFQRVAVHFCRLLPPFNLGEALIGLSTYNMEVRLATDLQASTDAAANLDSIIPQNGVPSGLSLPKTPFAWDIAGRSILALYGEAVLYFLLAVAIDTWRSDVRFRAAAARCMRSAFGPLLVFSRAAWGFATTPRSARTHRPFEWHLADARRRYAATDAAAANDANAAACATAMAAAAGMSTGGGRISHTGRIDEDAEYNSDMDGEALLPLAPLGARTSNAGSNLSRQDSLALAVRMVEAGSGARERTAVAGEAMDAGPEDPDVALERVRMEQPGAVQENALCLKHLRKVYSTQPPKVAVHDLSLGVRLGERFGFLGANGAGKSTTLSILSGQAAATAGDAYVSGYSINMQHDLAQHVAGYCPQVDPLLEHMSAREQLYLYARLKGVPEAVVVSEVADLVNRCGLPNAMADRPSGTLSGGNKRKVALAISLVGRPSVVLLDEPSSGMDPGARRMMWDAILRATRREGDGNGSGGGGGGGGGSGGEVALVLTTHYMEECEALCERVGIMNKGRLACLGSSQHLKSRFGGSYLLEVHGPEEPARQEQVTLLLRTNFPGARLEENHFGHMKLSLPAQGLSLSRVFQVMEAHKAELGISAYSVSQPSLEQVFLAVCGIKLSEEGHASGAAE